MPRKFTYEYVRDYFKERGCELLEPKYVNARTKMKYKCSCGNTSEITFHDFQQGKRCQKCGGNAKHTFDHVYNSFREQGCELLETKYVNSLTKMEYRCSCGNKSFISFNSFMKGSRCKKCGNKKCGNKKCGNKKGGNKKGGEKLRLDIEEIKQYFKDCGCELLEEYKHSHIKMKYKCSCGEISEITFGHFQEGKRCKKCSGNEKHTYEYVYKYFRDHGCELLETEYKNSHKCMKYKCSCGNIAKINWNNFQQGKRCQKCAGNEKLTFDYVYNSFREQGCELLEPKYVNSLTKMEYRCSCGNIDKITWGSFQQGTRCKKCSGSEKPTLEYVYNYFKEHGYELLENTYIDSKTMMKYKCSCGNIAKITYNNFQQGYRCKKCGIEKRSGKNSYNWNPDREYINLNKRSKNFLSGILRKQFNTKNPLGLYENEKFLEIVGYTADKLRDHILNHPNWEKVKNIKWDFDHIFPINAFIKIGIIDPKIINALENIQPMEHIENIKKSNNYNKIEFKKYLESKNIFLQDIK